MKTKSQITSSEVIKTPTIYSVCVLALFIFLSQMAVSQDVVASLYKPHKTTVQPAAVDTLNPAFAVNQAKIDSIQSLYFRGTDDADNSYTAKKSGKWIVLGTSIIGTPVLGLIPAVIFSSVCPSARNLHMPDEALSHNPAYVKGYKDEAHDIKKRAVWGHYLAGSAIWLAVMNVAII
jgi:hypothetical protein